MTCDPPERMRQSTDSLFDRIAFEIYLIRHGETRMNRERRYLGRSDVPLDEEGREKLYRLLAAGHVPDIDFLVSSPLKRCLESAEIFFPNRPPDYIDEDFTERDFGTFEGETYDDLIKRPEYVVWLADQGAGRPPQGESQQEIMARVQTALARLIDRVLNKRVQEPALRSVAVMAHGGVIMEIMKLLGFTDYYSWQLTNGSWIRLPVDAEGRLLDLKPQIGGGIVGRMV
jgi:alpha-ribazole phosphatase